MGIRALLSRADGSETDVDLAGAKPPRLARDELLWVDAQGADPGELGIIRKALKLSDASAAVLDAIPRKPRAIVHSDTVEIVGLAPTDDPDADPVPLQILVRRLGRHAPRRADPVSRRAPCLHPGSARGRSPHAG